MKKLFLFVTATLLFSPLFWREMGLSRWISGGEAAAQNISVNTTGAANSTTSMFEVLQPSTADVTKGIFSRRSGALGAAGRTAYSFWAEAICTGATSTNVAGYFSASGATNNYSGIFAAGNVGILTTAPTFPLEVLKSDAGVMRLNSGTANHYLDIYNANSGGNSYWYFIPGSACNAPITFYNRATASTDNIWLRNNGGSWNGMRLFHNDTYGGIWCDGNTPLALQASGTGKVGIGIATPDVELWVKDQTGAAGENIVLKIQNGRNVWAEENGPAIAFWAQDGREFGRMSVRNNTGDGGNSYLTLSGRTAEVITERMRINSTGALAFSSSSAFGSSGQVLTSAGSTGPPTWTTVAGGGGGGSCFSSGFKEFTTVGTTTYAAPAANIKIEVFGAGASGGASSGSNRNGCGGGGGGGYSVGCFVGVSGNLTIVISDGGAGVWGTNADGANGTGNCSVTGTGITAGGIYATPGVGGKMAGMGGTGGLGYGGSYNTTIGNGGNGGAGILTNPTNQPGTDSNGGGPGGTVPDGGNAGGGGGGGYGGGSGGTFGNVNGAAASTNSGAGGGGAAGNSQYSGKGGAGRVIVYW